MDVIENIGNKIYNNVTSDDLMALHRISDSLKMPYFHCHPQYETLYIKSGGIFVTSNTKTVEINAPAIVFHAPFMLHRACLIPSEASLYERYIINFSRDLYGRIHPFVPEISNVFQGAMSYVMLSRVQEQDLTPMFEKLQSAFDKHLLQKSELLLALIFEQINRAVPFSSFKFVEEKNDYIGNVLIYITENCTNDISVESIQKLFYISRAKLSRDFAEYTGMTVKRYIIHCRLSRAKRLMRLPIDRRPSLAQIASMCGFCDDSHLINTFRRFEGMTPGEYEDSVIEK